MIQKSIVFDLIQLFPDRNRNSRLQDNTHFLGGRTFTVILYEDKIVTESFTMDKRIGFKSMVDMREHTHKSIRR